MLQAVSQNRIRIGLFDSGVGGLSVLRQLETLPQKLNRPVDFLYIGDTARCPYGNRPVEEIHSFISQIIGWLSAEGVSHIVMACNTSAALGLDYARQRARMPIYDLINPVALKVASKYKRVGVIATSSTAKSKAFTSRIKAHSPDVEVIEIGCPALVPLVESGQLQGAAVEAALEEYLKPLEKSEVEAIIFGCTHFPFLTAAVKSVLKSNIDLIDPAQALTEEIGRTIATGNTKGTSQASLYITGEAAKFAATADVCLQLAAGTFGRQRRVEHLDVEQLIARQIDITAADMAPNVVRITSGSARPDSKILAP